MPAKMLCTIENMKLMTGCMKLLDEDTIVFFAVVVAVLVVDEAVGFLKVVVVVEVRILMFGLFLPDAFDVG